MVCSCWLSSHSGFPPDHTQPDLSKDHLLIVPADLNGPETENLGRNANLKNGNLNPDSRVEVAEVARGVLNVSIISKLTQYLLFLFVTEPNLRHSLASCKTCKSLQGGDDDDSGEMYGGVMAGLHWEPLLDKWEAESEDSDLERVS